MTKPRISLTHIALASLIIVMLGLLIWQRFLVPQREQTERVAQQSQIQSTSRKLAIGNQVIQVEIRDTPEGRALGLSGSQPLSEDQGMLFIFDDPQIPGFWMKDMLFDLDIIWIRDGIVVDITKNLKAPSTYRPKPEEARPIKAVDWVLEVTAGFVDRNDTNIGDQVELVSNDS